MTGRRRGRRASASPICWAAGSRPASRSTGASTTTSASRTSTRTTGRRGRTSFLFEPPDLLRSLVRRAGSAAGRAAPLRRAARLTSLAKEGAELGERLVRPLLGDVVPAVQRAAGDVAGPRAPDREHVVPVLEVPARAPQREHGAADPALAVEVGEVVGVVERRAGAVVLAHRVDRGRVVGAAAVRGDGLAIEERRVEV